MWWLLSTIQYYIVQAMHHRGSKLHHPHHLFILVPFIGGLLPPQPSLSFLSLAPNLHLPTCSLLSLPLLLSLYLLALSSTHPRVAHLLSLLFISLTFSHSPIHPTCFLPSSYLSLQSFSFSPFVYFPSLFLTHPLSTSLLICSNLNSEWNLVGGKQLIGQGDR